MVEENKDSIRSEKFDFNNIDNIEQILFDELINEKQGYLDEKEEEEGNLKCQAILQVIQEKKDLDFINNSQIDEQEKQEIFEQIENTYIQKVQEENFKRSQILNKQDNLISENWGMGMYQSIIKRTQVKDYDDNFQRELDNFNIKEQEEMMNKMKLKLDQQKQEFNQKIEQDAELSQLKKFFSDQELWEIYNKEQRFYKKQEKEQNILENQEQIQQVENQLSSQIQNMQKEKEDKKQNFDDDLPEQLVIDGLILKLTKSQKLNQKIALEKIEKQYNIQKSNIKLQEDQVLDSQNFDNFKQNDQNENKYDDIIIESMAIAETLIKHKIGKTFGLNHCLIIALDNNSNWIGIELSQENFKISTQVNFYKSKENFEQTEKKQIQTYQFQLKDEYQKQKLLVKNVKDFIQPFSKKNYQVLIHNCYDFANKIGQHYLKDFNNKGIQLFNDLQIQIIQQDNIEKLAQQIGEKYSLLKNWEKQIEKSFKFILFFSSQTKIILQIILPLIFLLKEFYWKNKGQMSSEEIRYEIIRIVMKFFKSQNFFDLIGSNKFFNHIAIEIIKIIIPLVKKQISQPN